MLKIGKIWNANDIFGLMEDDFAGMFFKLKVKSFF